jgi:protein BCP1
LPNLSQAAAAAAAAAAGPVIVYVRPEDEFFHKQASVAFTFPVEGRAVGKDELQPLRLVLLLPASKVPAAR